jgi:AcrR family transcriptional regulator
MVQKVYRCILGSVLSTNVVVKAGVKSVRKDGLPGLGIRALSDRLGVTPMALYRHVHTADELKVRVVEAVLSLVPDVAPKGAFAPCARRWAIGAHGPLAEHPGVARHVLTNWFRIPQALDWLEALLAAAERSGLRGPRGVAAVNSIFMFVLMRVEAEETIRGAGAVRRRLPRGPGAARWPHLRRNAREYEVARFDRHFGYGLETLLAGIESGGRHARP